MLLVIGICIGLVVGMLASIYIQKVGAIGNLVIADDPDDGAYIFLELMKTDMGMLRRQAVIKLNVINKGRTAHK